MRFSENFTKFKGDMPPRAFVLQVLKVEKCELSKPFTDYDTLFIKNGQREHYKITDGTQILIILVDDRQHLFTTLRSYDDEKFKYYKDMEGRWVELSRT